jgi:UDPglucose--hexose-1-phosphate uridylyltransferase
MVVIVPFWAVWSYEAMIVSIRRMPRIVDMTKDEQKAFSICIRWLTIEYDN